ncbi:MAG TPA: hypothetical protein VL283_05545, partial [Candidatus Baltobacteraceae bacterium]|nr:hypothetical protein [Candidatus Baltobacteraceae bacterium]
MVEQGRVTAGVAEAASRMTTGDWAEMLDASVENVLTAFPMPFAAATGFVINGNEVLAPMVTEERTVVAAASKAAALCRPKGFSVKVRAPIAVAQMLYPRPEDPDEAVRRVKRVAAEVVAALRQDDRMVARGGGPVSLDARIAQSARGPLLVVEARIDVRDAMGANAATETGHRAGA